MLTTPFEIARRGLNRVTSRLHSLPILALSVHSACNCRCVMCDIWKANREKREISADTLQRHFDAIKRLRVQRVMLTGGEPLLHSNLWKLCHMLCAEGIRLSLITTGLLIEAHADAIAAFIDEVVVSIDGPPHVHDAIRRVPGAFERLGRGIAALNARRPRVRTIARCVVQRANYTAVAATIDAVEAMGVEQLSFLAADVTSEAFNRPRPWPPDRQQEIALGATDLDSFEYVIDRLEHTHSHALTTGFVEGGSAGLRRILAHYRAATGVAAWPAARCNAAWVSAVLEAGGEVRPCFFQPAYARSGQALDAALNSPEAIRVRRQLDVASNPICQRCVCRLSLPLTMRA